MQSALSVAEQVGNNLALIPFVNEAVGVLRILVGIVQAVAGYFFGACNSCSQDADAEHDYLHVKHGLANIGRGLLEISYIPNLIFAAIHDGALNRRMGYGENEVKIRSVWTLCRDTNPPLERRI